MKQSIIILIFCTLNSVLYSQTNAIEISHYILPEFTQGVILMKSGSKSEVSLNYNSLTEEMIIEKNGNKSAIKKEFIETIDTVFINERKFIAKNDAFLELIYHSKFEIFIEHNCKISAPSKPSAYGGDPQSSASTSYSSLISNDRAYELKLPDDYKVQPYTVYWLKNDEGFNKFVSLRQLSKLYYSKRNIFKSFVKKYDVKYDDQQGIIQLIRHLEEY